MPRPTELSINYQAISHNFAIAQKMGRNCKTVAVVKADGYGHGAIDVAMALENADGFAVAIPEEMSQLKSGGISKPILVLEGPFDREDVREIIEKGAQTVIHSDYQLKWLEKNPEGRPIVVWLKIDSGMSRLGFSPCQIEEVISRCRKTRIVKEIILMSHLACAEEPDNPMNLRQTESLMGICKKTSLPMSISNSAALISGIAPLGSWTRPGIMLFGYSPLQSKNSCVSNLKSTMNLVSKVVAIREVKPGETVGYGRAWEAIYPTRIGTIPIGYADGYPRHARSGTPVLIDGCRASIAGRVSMDMLTVDLSAVPSAKVGSKVTLWGGALDIGEVARMADTIPYELMTGISHRVPRRKM